MNNGYKSKRKKVAIIGAGKMTKPLVDYFIDKFGYQVFLVNRTVSTAEKVIDGRIEFKIIICIAHVSSDHQILKKSVHF